MLNSRYICILISFLSFYEISQAKVVYDTANDNIQELISKKNTVYVLRYSHRFENSLSVPEGCELRFEGGSLSGFIVFNGTLLSGNVNLHGSSISGHITNSTFDASWLCHTDGLNDDAVLINQILDVCNSVFFPKGVYKLISKFSPDNLKDADCARAIHSHIGIFKNKTIMKGEDGAVFMSDFPLNIITIYSNPYDIKNSVQDIKIENIIFKVNNNGVDFYEPIYVIEAIGVNGLVIRNCYFDDFWGDAICLSHYGDTPNTGERTRNQKVTIINNTIVGGNHHNNRNGISVINGKNVLIKGNIIRNTSRKDMPGAIDVEANNTAYTIDNIMIINNNIDGCEGSSGGICIYANNKGAPAYHIRVENNIIRNSSFGLTFVVKDIGTTGYFVVKNNHTDANTRPYKFGGNGKSKNWKFIGNVFDRPIWQDIPGDIEVEKLVVKNNKKKDCFCG